MHKFRAYVLSLWSLWDPLYYGFSHLTVLDNDRKNGVFRVKLVRYKGHSVTLMDGTHIQKNDLLVKIHLHNVRLLKDMYQIESEFRKGLFIYKKIKDSLPKLAQFVQNHERMDEIKGIVGISMLHQGSERLGFEIHSIFNRFYRLFKTTAQYPIHLLSSDHPFRTHKRARPEYLFMSKATLMNRYFKNLDQRAISKTMDGL
ncbi:MAG: YkoP family protein [Tuberibacillus sp.]